MATSDSDNNAISGGLLVVLGIVVALGAIYFFANNTGHIGSRAPNITINADTPKPNSGQ